MADHRHCRKVHTNPRKDPSPALPVNGSDSLVTAASVHTRSPEFSRHGQTPGRRPPAQPPPEAASTRRPISPHSPTPTPPLRALPGTRPVSPHRAAPQTQRGKPTLVPRRARSRSAGAGSARWGRDPRAAAQNPPAVGISRSRKGRRCRLRHAAGPGGRSWRAAPTRGRSRRRGARRTGRRPLRWDSVCAGAATPLLSACVSSFGRAALAGHAHGLASSATAGPVGASGRAAIAVQDVGRPFGSNSVSGRHCD